MRRRGWVLAVAAGLAVGLLAGCSSGSSNGGGAGPGAATTGAPGGPGQGSGGQGGSGSGSSTPGNHGEGINVATSGAVLPSATPTGTSNTTPLYVPGYSYGTAAKATVSRLSPARAQYKQFMTTGTTKSVKKGGGRIGEIAVYALDPKYTASPVFRAQVASGFAGQVAGGNAKVSTKVVKGVEVQVALGEVGVMSWYQRGCLVSVIGSKDLATLTPFVERYVTG